MQYKRAKAGQIDYQAIINEEQLSENLRLDNYTILLFLINIVDSEIKNYFLRHIKNMQKLRLKSKYGDDHEQSQLLSDLNSKTEETFQSLQEKFLTNEEYTVIRNKRSMKDEGYLEIFRQTINQGQAQFSIDQLMQNLKDFAQ
jgi:hypothetical protein